jgi:hypothetical protein
MYIRSFIFFDNEVCKGRGSYETPGSFKNNIRVTRWVDEKIAQNIGQAMFVKINA